MAEQQAAQGDETAEWVTGAAQAVAAGDWARAEQLWRQVQQRQPDHPHALYSLGVHAYRRGEPGQALQYLQQARRVAPREPMVVLSIAMAWQALGDLDGQWQAIGEALALDPYFLPALLAKAEFLHERGRGPAAAAIYRDALQVAPEPAGWPPALRRRLEQARERVVQDQQDMEAYLRAAASTSLPLLQPAEVARWDEALAIASGRSRPYRSECNRLLVPRLPAITFYEPALFPWIEALQAHTDAIQAELMAALAVDEEGFVPYVAYAPDQPVNQWAHLNHSRAWSSYPLWAHGRPMTANLARCPATAAALAQVDAAHIGGICPNAMFSVLAPRTTIPPHNGETNARLVAHLPLVVPERCRFRVGHDWRQWERGKVLVFDDSIEHEAHNDSDQPRVVMIFDVWNPLLSMAERGMVQTTEQALQAYRGR